MSDPRAVDAPDDVRTDLALVIVGAAHRDGWAAVGTKTAYAIADAVIARPGLLRAILDAPRDRAALRAASAAGGIVSDMMYIEAVGDEP